MLGRVEPPPRDDERSHAGGGDLAHLRRDELRVRGRVQAARRGSTASTAPARRRARRTSAPSARPSPGSSTTGSRRSPRDRSSPTCSALAAGSTARAAASAAARRAGIRRPVNAARDSTAAHLTDAATIAAVAAYRYLIVGGGMTGDSACRGIRDHDSDGSIGLFGAESHEPYVRPPLTKALWSGKDEASIFRGTPDLGVDLHAGRRIASLDLDAPRGDRRHGRDARATTSSSSRRAARHVDFPVTAMASSTSAPSTTTTGCAALRVTASASPSSAAASSAPRSPPRCRRPDAT